MAYTAIAWTTAGNASEMNFGSFLSWGHSARVTVWFVTGELWGILGFVYPELERVSDPNVPIGDAVSQTWTQSA